MAQVFSMDSQNGALGTSLTTATEVTCATGNFLTPPFNNAKAVIRASCFCFIGAASTSIRLRLRRNPPGDNTVVGDTGVVNSGVTGNANGAFYVDAIDPIPDGRAVQYVLTVTMAGGSAGTYNAGTITTELISG